MEIHLVDGTYELFRHHMGLPREVAATSPRAATRGVVGSVLDLLERGATHVGVATDTVIESFRNDLWPAYKTGAGIEPVLRDQFPLVEDALAALGVTVWGMVEVEADDALATAAARLCGAAGVGRVLVCTPDKDLAQCVRGTRVVQHDRRRDAIRDEDGVWERFGVGPASIPDYLALVGDAADGFPGLPGWGARSAAAVLARYGHIDAIPDDPAAWDVPVRGAARLYATMRMNVHPLGPPPQNRRSAWTDAGPDRVLQVNGDIVNLTAGQVAVPPVVVSLQDQSGKELSQVTANVPALGAGGKAPFTVQIPSPPESVRNLQVRFTKAK